MIIFNFLTKVIFHCFSKLFKIVRALVLDYDKLSCNLYLLVTHTCISKLIFLFIQTVYTQRPPTDISPCGDILMIIIVPIYYNYVYETNQRIIIIVIVNKIWYHSHDYKQGYTMDLKGEKRVELLKEPLNKRKTKRKL